VDSHRRGIDDDAIVLLGAIDAHVSVANVIEHAFGGALQWIAPAAPGPALREDDVSRTYRHVVAIVRNGKLICCTLIENEKIPGPRPAAEVPLHRMAPALTVDNGLNRIAH